MSAGLTCLLLGEEPLLLRCAEVLLERGHAIGAVVTRAPGLSAWCAARGISVLGRNQYSAWLDRHPVDVLCSIAYPAPIGAVDLVKVRRAALNYHDGPLPRYAGINASAWALLNGECSHAVTWHELSPGLDRGDIVEQRELELDTRETSLTLHIKNAALALDAFRSLLERLESGRLEAHAQPEDVPRSAYSRHDRPVAFAAIDFGAPAVAIDRLVRACEFGPHPNRFGLAKIVHGGRAVLVREAAPCWGTGEPGLLLHASEDSWQVACGSDALSITRFATLTGNALSASEAARALQVGAGDRLELRSPAAWDNLSRLVAESEPFFVDALAACRSPALGLPVASSAGPRSLDCPLAVHAAAASSSGAVDAPIAAFALLVASLCREDDVVLSWVDGRARARLGSAHALFFPSVPFRVSIERSSDARGLISAIGRGRALLEAQSPFLFDLVARHPELATRSELQQGSLSAAAVLIGDVELPPGASLGLSLKGSESRLLSNGQIPELTLRALAESLRVIIDQLVATPDRALSELALVSPRERRRQLSELNPTARPFPDTLCLHELFERRVERDPDAVALIYRGRSMSFGELERAANQVAHGLLARGVRPGEYVAVSLPRGFALVQALLGILKAGAAYVPLDPGFPVERARFILDDAGCQSVLVSGERGAELAGEHALPMDGAWLQGMPDHRPPRASDPNQPCYAIFTSGSTGRPKGVVLTHRAVVNTIDWVNRSFGVEAGDRLLFVTSPSFDLSVYDVFGVLGAGASLEIATDSQLGEPVELARRLCAPELTVWDSAPSTLVRLLPFLPNTAPAAGLRLILLSGDWIPVSLPDALRTIFPRAEVHSLGGATEAAIWSNHYAIGTVDREWPSIPYGRPIQNARYYVLDGRREPLPLGATGELYIAGACLAQGYLNRPELTRERFVDDPFVAGERMYQTGDLARYFPDGNIEFLGRADFQVKIRGFRVELGEVEHALSALPEIRDALCTTHLDMSGQRALVAYVVGQRGLRPDEQQVRAALSRVLPDFMVPSYIVPLAALPLSQNGKLDRSALPSPVMSASATSYAAPRNELEAQLAEIWEELLERRPIGVNDNFFELGGHSLLAVLLVTRLKSRLGLSVPLSRVLEKPTIAAFAASLSGQEEIERRSDHLLALHAHGPRPALVLVAGVGGYGFTYGGFPRLLGSDQPVFTLQGVGAEDGADVRELSVEEMARIYEVELQRAGPDGPLVLGGFSFGMLPAFELGRRLLARGRRVPLLVSFDGFAPGFPHLLPLPARLAAHAREFLQREGALRQAYLRDRARNVRRRALTLLGRDDGAEIAPALELAEPAMRARLRRLWAMHLRARARYHPQARLPCDMLLIKVDQPERWVANDMHDQHYGWKDFVAGEISVVTVPGEHLGLFSSDTQPLVAKAVKHYIDQLEPAAAPLAASAMHWH